MTPRPPSSPDLPAEASVVAPREPTEAMLKAGRDAAQSANAHSVGWADEAQSVYRAMLSAAPQVAGEARGEAAGIAGEMPGSNGGFTMAVFKSSDVPLGSPLYALPSSPVVGGGVQPSPEAWKPGRDDEAALSLGRALVILDRLGFNWHLARGRTRPDEPLYGLQILDGEAVVAEYECDGLGPTIRCGTTIAALRPSAPVAPDAGGGE